MAFYSKAPRGRGGGGIGTRMRGQALPFDIDPELVEAADKTLDDDFDDDSGKEVYPEFGEMVMAAPATDDERREVQLWRELDAKRRAGPFWTGTRDDWAQLDAGNGILDMKSDPFENAQTYGKKHTKRAFKMADLSKVKLQPQFFPKELWTTIGYNKEDDTDDNTEGRPAKRQKKLGLAKKTALDKLAKFDEDLEEEANVEADEEDEGGDKEEEGEEFDRGPEDDDFEEDEEDANDDYNAEGYFDAGDEDFEEQGGDEYGEDGGY